MIGHVIGAFSTTATRRSVILSCDGIEFFWTFCGAASRSASVTRPKADAPAAALPMVVKNERRSSRRSTAGFIAPPCGDGPSLYASAALSTTSAREQGQVDGVGHDPIPARGRMQVVAAIDGRGQARGLGGIAGDGVEVDDAVELAAGADPLVDRLAVGLALRARIRGEPLEGQDGRAVDAHAVAV